MDKKQKQEFYRLSLKLNIILLAICWFDVIYILYLVTSTNHVSLVAVELISFVGLRYLLLGLIDVTADKRPSYLNYDAAMLNYKFWHRASTQARWKKRASNVLGIIIPCIMVIFISYARLFYDTLHVSDFFETNEFQPSIKKKKSSPSEIARIHTWSFQLKRYRDFNGNADTNWEEIKDDYNLFLNDIISHNRK